MEKRYDDIVAVGSGEIMKIRQEANADIVSAQTRAQHCEHEMQQLRNELNAQLPTTPDPNHYTSIVCELDHSRTEVRDRQQHINDLNVMLRLSEDQVARERSSVSDMISVAEQNRKVQ